MKKRIGVILIGIVVLVAGFFIIKRLIWNYKVAHAEKIVELSTNQVLVYQSNIQIGHLIKKINGKLTTNPVIDTNKIGKQTIKFHYTTDEGYPVTYEVEIEVVDVTPPKIFQLNSKTIYTGYEGELEKNLFCGDDYDPNPKCYIEGEYDVNTPGQYDVTFIGEDSSGNKSTNAFKLNVINKPTSTSQGEASYTDFQEIKTTYQKEGAHFGIDVSHWQGDIDFQKVKNAGVEFVFIRVGRGKGIGKGSELDEKFEQNIKGFNEVGIPVGIYYYSNANSKKDAEKEAKWIIKQIKNHKVELEVAYDWENWNSFQQYDLSFHDLKETNTAFDKVLKDKGYTGMLYGSKSYLESIWGYYHSVWLAHYAKETDYMGHYKVWQICNDGKVDGIKGAVDLDIRYE